jgi:signal peptidase I
MFSLFTPKIIKRGRDMLAGVRKTIRINRDILAAAHISELNAVCDELEEALRGKNPDAVQRACEKLEAKADRVFPAQRHASLRENVEVLLVAVIVAMAVRTFFVQPFKIPTGSMQPTLYGIYPPPRDTASPYDDGAPNPLQRVLNVALFGWMHEKDGYRTRGDHIFVDKFTYHFRQPKRGDVVVFETHHIEQMSPESRGKFYIKRLIGVGGDIIQIKPPHVLVNGEVLNSRPAFARIYSMQNGYKGYHNYTGSSLGKQRAPYLGSPEDTLEVRPNHLFVLGDNSLNSSDGRYWRDFQRRELVGRAFFVYWPFSARFGLVD